jgi:pimeloyl-ACP methyl ester carboxylesterase
MHEHIGESRLVVIPEAGHMSNLETPDAFNGALAEFLGAVTKG